MQIQQCHSYRQLFFIFTLILLLASLGTISSYGKKAASSIKAESSGGLYKPLANQPLALARYSILMKILHQAEESPFPVKNNLFRNDVMFPVGKSDKVYILSLDTNPSTGSPHPVQVACYKSSGKGVKRIYSVELKIVYKPMKEKIRVRNMLDVLSLLGDILEEPKPAPDSNALPEDYNNLLAGKKSDIKWSPDSNPVPGNISRVAKRDLSLCQDLVDYSYDYDYDSDVHRLYVQYFNSKTAGSLDGNEPQLAFYVPTQSSQWYKTYGFPVADCELTVKGVKQKYQKAVSIASLSSNNEGCCCEDSGSIQSIESPMPYQPLALARYHTLKQIQFKYDGYAIPEMSDCTRDDIIFTLGRSDKFYIVSQGHSSTEGDNSVRLICYKSRGKRVRLIYTIKLKMVHEPPRDRIRVRNMLDYLSLMGNGYGEPNWDPCSYVITGNISREAKRDLSLSQKLVAYSCHSINGLLHIQYFDPKIAAYIDEHTQTFFLPDKDKDNWYKKYGFPVPDCELTIKRGRKK